MTHHRLPNLSSLSIDAPPKLAFKQRRANEQEAKQSVFRELNAQIVTQLISNLVYYDPSNPKKSDVCELLSNYCRIQTGVCDDDYVFEVALRAFGVNSAFKKNWLLRVRSLDFNQQAYKPLPDKITNRDLFGFLCSEIQSAKRALKDSAALYYRGDDDEKYKDELDYGEGVVEGIVESWLREVDLKAIFLLSTIGSKDFKPLDFVLAWRKVVANTTENSVFVETPDVPERRKGRYYEIVDVSSLTFLYNFAWVMAELFDPSSTLMTTMTQLVNGYITINDVGEEHDVLLPLNVTDEDAFIYLDMPETLWWNAKRWINELIVEKLSKNKTATSRLLFDNHIHPKLFPNMNKPTVWNFYKSDIEQMRLDALARLA